MVLEDTLTVDGRRQALCVHHQLFSIHFKSIHSDCSYECTPKRVHNSPGHSEVSLAATTPCQLQLCSVRELSFQVIWLLLYECLTETCCLHLQGRIFRQQGSLEPLYVPNRLIW